MAYPIKVSPFVRLLALKHNEKFKKWDLRPIDAIVKEWKE